MRERPIIFSSEMIKAICDGRKTMTRRPIKPAYDDICLLMSLGKLDYNCPYGQSGDRLYIKETWGLYSCGEDGDLVKYKVSSQDDIIPGHCIVFKASDTFKDLKGWRSPRFMPKWVSRITLEIVDVKVERLQEISIADADAEGFGGDYPSHVFPSIFPGNLSEYGHLSMSECFGVLWDSLYIKKPEYQWKANIWVWVIEFRDFLKTENESHAG